jgi:hypothetical protein
MDAGEPGRSQEAGGRQSRSERVERVGRSQHLVLRIGIRDRDGRRRDRGWSSARCTPRASALGMPGSPRGCALCASAAENSGATSRASWVIERVRAPAGRHPLTCPRAPDHEHLAAVLVGREDH